MGEFLDLSVVHSEGDFEGAVTLDDEKQQPVEVEQDDCVDLREEHLRLQSSRLNQELGEASRLRLQRSAGRREEREAAKRRREIKGKAVCLEDTQARQNARKTTSIARFFTSSRNSQSQEPLRMEPVQLSLLTPQTELSNTFVAAVSLDTLSLHSQSLGGSSSGGLTGFKPIEAAIEVRHQLRSTLVQISDEEAEDEVETDDDVQEVPPPKKARQSYNCTRRFQNEWAAKLVWAEPIRKANGEVYLVKCKVCSVFEKKTKIMGPKWDTLTKHEGRRKAAFDMPKYGIKAGEWYISSTARHQINLRLFSARQPTSVLQQVNMSPSAAKSKKIVQFCTIYQILASGRPMVEYEEREALYAFLNVPNLPRMHWTGTSGWKMAEFMHKQVQSSVKKKISVASFVALTCDEVTSVDNGSWLCIHAYVVDNYVRIPHLISLQRVVDGGTADHLTVLITKALETGGDLSYDEMSRKLLCFGADCASTFQGVRSGITAQIQTKFAPFCLGVHCMAHRCNLAAKSLSNLPIFDVIQLVIQLVIQRTHAYFSKSPKRLAEYQKLADVMETKGLKPLLQVTTRWVSLLEPLRRLLADYRTLLAKMKADSDKNDTAEKCLALLLDPYAILGMTAIMPLLETIDLLVTFAQKRDVYVCDFVAALKIAEGQLFTLYVDKSTAFGTDEFWAFKNLLDCSHSQIHMKWISDLNDESAQLTFIANGQKIWAQHNELPVDRDAFMSIVSAVKFECGGAARQLLRELESRFPSHAIMDALGVVYPQYWLQAEAEDCFPKHLDTLMSFYCEPKLIELDNVKRLIPPILDRYSLETQQGLFKLSMLNNSRKHMEGPFDLNPLTRLWRSLDSSTVLRVKAFPEFFKLVEVAIVQVLGSVEDERCFSSLSFLKNKLRNSLATHLECVVSMYSQKIFTLETFPYDAAYNEWASAVDQRYGI